MTGGAEFVRAEEKQRELLLAEARRLAAGQFAADEMEAHFTALPPRYFQIHSAAEIVEDIGLARDFMRLQVADDGESTLTPVVAWRNAPDRGYNAVKICTWDRAGLFSKIAGSFSANGLNILSAQVFTRTDGIALDTFFVTDARTGSLAEREQREAFAKLLDRVLGGGADLRALISRQKILRPLYQAYTGEQMPTQIQFDNDASEFRTVIEIETEDRVGLLYAISETFAELKLDISAAKICTEKGAAIDSFYVGEREGAGGKIIQPERQKIIERNLRRAIKALDTAAG
jgi:[protein-PII] uridylyltransferase